MPHRARKGPGNTPRMSRRQWISALGLGGAAALAGCTGDDGNGGNGNGGNGNGNGGNGNGNGGNGNGDSPTADEPDPIDLSQSPPEVEGEYHATQASTFETLNPIYNNESNAGTAIDYALDMGYTFDQNNEVFGLLFEDLFTEDEGETWTIQIRDGLEFSDPYGQYTAEDFVYYVQEIHQSEWAQSVNSIDWAGVEVEQTGELEVQATLADPNIIWPETFAPLEYPIPRGLLEPYVEEEDAEGLQQDEELLELQFAGNMGAYVLDEWIRDGGTQYTRNDEYYLRDLAEDDDLQIFGEAPYFETLQVEIIEEESSRIAAIQTGETDNVELPPNRGQEFIEDEETMVVLTPTPFNNILSVNMRDNGWTAGPGNLFTVTEFRQAIAAAIDKQQYIDGILNGFARPHYTWQPEFSEWYSGTDELTLWGDPEEGVYGGEARELAEQALEQIDEDYTYDGDTLVNPDGDQVELEIYYNASSDTQELAVDFFSNEFESNLGITLNTNAIDATTFSENYWNAEPEGGTDTVNGEEVEWGQPSVSNPGPRSVTPEESWDFATIFGLNTYPRNPITNEAFFDGANSSYNPVGYYPGFDAGSIFEEMRAAESREELREAFSELLVNLNEEQPYIMLAFSDDIQAYNPDLRGPIANFSSEWDFSVWHKDD